MVELVLAEQDDPGDLAADGDDPRDRGENAKARRGGLLALRRTPFLGDVGLCGWLIVGHVQVSLSTLSARRTWNWPDPCCERKIGVGLALLIKPLSGGY